MDRTDKELAKRTGKAPINEGTSSTSSHSEIEKTIEPKKSIVTLKNDAKAIKEKG